jgi:hypothetical protein
VVEFGVEWVNEFPPPCDQNSLSFCDETALGFEAVMAAAGHHSAFAWGDGDARERDFRDRTIGGDDDDWLEAVEIAFFSSHGSTEGAVFRGYLGSDADSCAWTSSQGRYGDVQNLAFLCLDTCESIELDAGPIDVWARSFQGLHQLLGFTGLVSDSPWTGCRGYEFGHRLAADDVVAEAWLDACYSVWLDDHPVAMAAGRDGDEALARLRGERLSSELEDIRNDEIRAFRWIWRT